MNRIHIKQYSWTRILQLSLVISCLDILVITSRLLAQIIPDATLGAEKSRVTSNQEIHGINSTLIEGGAIRDSNLFHSFQEFNIDEGRGAYFSNPAAVQNIFSRVTGGNISKIFGTLGVLGNANLFFLNPNGILFGANASLDLQGSFLGSSGDRLFFENGWEFSASQPEAPPLLTINMPIGLGFLDNQRSKVENAGNLTVGFGQGITLAGNQVSSTGSINAPGGRVELLGTESVALLENAIIDVSSPTSGGTILIGGDFQGLGTVFNAQRTYVGDKVNINADAITNGNGGKVIVWADEVTGFYGNISARGGTESGNGGLVEVSGKEHLIFRGTVNTSTVNGLSGTLLLDPTNIIIANGSSDQGVDGSDTFAGNNSGVEGSILSKLLSEINDIAPTTIYESELEGLSGDTNIILQATNDIRLQDLSDDGLKLAAGGGVIAFSADADADGVGDFVMEDDIADTIFSNGRDIAISGANLIIGNIDTSVLTVGDAGELIETALFISDSPGGTLETISGNISNVEDVDLFQIYLTGEETFSASTVNPETTLNTQLFLFDADGLGVYANDTQAGCNCLQATLPAGNVLTPKEPGIYYLGISTFGDNAVSSEGEIFPSGFEVGFEAIRAPNGDGGLLPLSGWIGGLGLFEGSYRINLTGVEAVEATVVESIQPIGDSGSITLNATNGNITVGSLNTTSSIADAGLVNINANGNITMNERIETSANIGGGGNVSLTAGGNITLNPRASILSFGLLAGDIILNSQGYISITRSGIITTNRPQNESNTSSGNISMTANAIFLINGTFLNASTVGQGGAGSIRLIAKDSISLTGQSPLGGSSIGTTVSRGVEGTAGEITIETSSLLLTDGARINTSTGGVGDAGKITITATDAITLQGENSQGVVSGIFSALVSGAQGRSGGIIIETGSLSITNGPQIIASTEGVGDAGKITITATDAITLQGENSQGVASGIFSQVNLGANGNSEGIFIETNSLSLNEGSRIDSSTFGAGGAGKIEINVNKDILLSGESSQGFKSGIFSQVAMDAEGTAGAITINTSSFSLRNGAQLSSGTLGMGNAGDITIDTDSLYLTDGAFVSTGTRGEGEAGSLNINAQDITLDNGSLTAETRTGDQGNITIDKANTLLLGNNSEITTNATEQAIGGDITITSDVIVLQNNSNITANAIEGRGGNIQINTQGLFQDLDSEITAASELGIDGTISINNPDVDPASSLVELPDVPVDVSALLARNLCDIGRGKIGKDSSFINTGRGGLPPNPYEPLDSNNIFVDVQLPTEWTEKSTTNSSISEPATKPIIEASAWVINEKGNVELVSQLASKTVRCGSKDVDAD